MKVLNRASLRVLFFLLVTVVSAHAIPLTMSMAPSQQQECALTKVFIHEGTLSDMFVFHFTGDPVCTYIPKAFDEEKIAKGEPLQLTFFVPLGSIKTKQGRNSIHALNNTPCAVDYCVKVKNVTVPTKGIQYSITLDPSKRGLEYQSFQSITGEKGVMFKFHNQEALEKMNEKTASKRIRRVAFADKAKIILDYGHGGRDPGFQEGKIKEKEVNRAIGQKVAKLLKKKGYDVCLIREADESLALDQRTARARKCGQAAALISIHTNSASRSAVTGIETFCHTKKLFTTRLCKAKKNLMQQVQTVDAQLLSRSNNLAQSVHNHVLKEAKTKNSKVVDRKIKHKVAQLLLGTELPAILVELGFLTNQKEATLLQSNSYQQALAKGICNGIDDFLM